MPEGGRKAVVTANLKHTVEGRYSRVRPRAARRRPRLRAISKQRYERADGVRFFGGEDSLGIGHEDRIGPSGKPFQVSEALIKSRPVLAKVVRELKCRCQLVVEASVRLHLASTD